VLELLRDRFSYWQELGFLPSQKISPGYNNDQPIRERGWTHWHHLFNPRQLLYLGLLAEESAKLIGKEELVACVLGLNSLADWNSRLTRWAAHPGKEMIIQTFGNQALNTLYNYGCRGFTYLQSSFFLRLPPTIQQEVAATIHAQDARKTELRCDLWLTDPPYADAVNYHELSEFFLAWDDKFIATLFPQWHSDSKRALAVKGEDHSFRNPAVDRGPELISIAKTRIEKSSEQWVKEVKDFVLSDEGDLVGITSLKDDYVYEGYTVNEPWVV